MKIVKAVRREARTRIARSIARWLKAKAPYWSGAGGDEAIRGVAADLANGEWDEDTLGGTEDSVE